MMQIKPPIYFSKITKDHLVKSIVGNNIAIICSKSVYLHTHISQVIDDLAKDYNVKLFTDIRPEAPLSDLINIIDYYGKFPPQTIIGIGGGSVIDAAKALKVSFGNSHIEELLARKASLPTHGINMIAIPTTAGTGAELSHGAIIFAEDKSMKVGLRGEVIQPNAVFIDIELYKTLPQKLMAEVGFDCLTHAIETYLSTKSNALIQFQSVSAIRCVFDHLENAVNGNNHSLSKMAIASTLMGINLAYSTTCLPHRIQYIIGPLTKTTHAQGLIAIYNGWLKLIVQDKKKSNLRNLERDLNFKEDLKEKILLLTTKLKINLKLSDIGLNETHIESIADQVNGPLEYDPSYKNKNTLIEVLKHSM